jgi:hypothetical protein
LNWKNKTNNEEYMTLITSDFILQETKPCCWNISIYKTPSKTNPAASVRLMVAAQNDPEWVINIIKEEKRLIKRILLSKKRMN